MVQRRTEATSRRPGTLVSAVEERLVKSASRALEILEYFDDFQRPMSVMDIADGLGYPQSSTSALLRSLYKMGYLSYNSTDRTYISTSRVALLGNWLISPIYADGAIVSVMRELNELTGYTIVLGMRNGLYVQYIYIVQAQDPNWPHWTLGTMRRLVETASGYAVLATLSDTEVVGITLRSNAEAKYGSTLVKLSGLQEELARVRRQGYALTCNTVVSGVGMIAATLPSLADQPRMIIGIGGPSELLEAREAELSSALLQGIERSFSTKKAAADHLSGALLCGPVNAEDVYAG